ncbi:MAG: hypothetical protein WCG47_27175, partial [Dermatophilaceae bacterium]
MLRVQDTLDTGTPGKSKAIPALPHLDGGYHRSAGALSPNLRTRMVAVDALNPSRAPGRGEQG